MVSRNGVSSVVVLLHNVPAAFNAAYWLLDDGSCLGCRCEMDFPEHLRAYSLVDMLNNVTTYLCKRGVGSKRTDVATGKHRLCPVGSSGCVTEQSATRAASPLCVTGGNGRLYISWSF